MQSDDLVARRLRWCGKFLASIRLPKDWVKIVASKAIAKGVPFSISFVGSRKRSWVDEGLSKLSAAFENAVNLVIS
jgi:hypothetical protein